MSATTCPECKKPKCPTPRDVCADCHSYTSARDPWCHGHAPQPTAQPVDLNALIVWAKLFATVPTSVLPPYHRAERDTIVLALRVRRIMKHKQCSGVMLADDGDLFLIETENGPVYAPLDEAERILGIEVKP